MSIKVVFVGDFPKQSISKAFAAFEALVSEDDQLEVLTLLSKNSTSKNPNTLSSITLPTCALYKMPIELYTIDPTLEHRAKVARIPEEGLERLRNAGVTYCKERGAMFNDALFEHSKELTVLRSIGVTHFIMAKSMKIPGIVTKSDIFKTASNPIKVIEV